MNKDNNKDNKESLIVRQTEYNNVKLKRRRTGKSKEYLNNLLSHGCPKGQKKCICCKKYDANSRKKTRTEMHIWCREAQYCRFLAGDGIWGTK